VQLSLTNSGTIGATSNELTSNDAAGIRFNAGRAVINNSGQILTFAAACIDLTQGTSAASNHIVNSGLLSSAQFLSILAGEDSEPIINTGTMIGGVVLNGGADVVRNRGLIEGDVDTGAGDNLIDLR
jgi:hypothetical protein